MPETTDYGTLEPGTLNYLALELPAVADRLRKAREHANTEYRVLTMVMREAREAGMSLKAVSSYAGLSIAQVQRICDLSKDASPKELAAKEWRKNGGKGYFASEDELAQHLSKDRSE